MKLPKANTEKVRTKAFKKMKKLRLLQLAGVELVGDFEYISKDLRWLCWHGFPLTCIPRNFYQGSLVSIQLENSNITILWKEAQVLILFSAFHELLSSFLLMQFKLPPILILFDHMVLLEIPSMFRVFLYCMFFQ